MRESKAARRERAAAVIRRLEAQMPEANIELRYQTPLQLLVSVVLSAQCTDKRVNMVTPALFARFPDAEAYARASRRELQGLIKTCGLYRSKAKSIISMAKALVSEHGGRVPVTRSELQALPGVGRKSAGVVSIHLGGDAALPVDTHIRRLSYRLGFSRQTDPDKVERELTALLPSEQWAKAHHLLIWHGRRTCVARSPACDRCGVAELCPKIGVPKVTRKLAPRSARPSTASSVS